MWDEMTAANPDIVPAVSTLGPKEDGDFLFAVGYSSEPMGDSITGLYT